MKIGDRVYLKETCEFGFIGNGPSIGTNEWLVGLDNRHSIWMHEHELLPVKVSVLEGKLTHDNVRRWLIGGESLNDYMLFRDLGSTVRITIEKVKGDET